MRFDPANTVPMFFDLATSTGWAVRALDGRIKWGSFSLVRGEVHIGKWLHQFEDAVGALTHEHRATVIIYEAPFVGPKLAKHTAIKLFGLASHLEYLCWKEYGLPCFEEGRSDILKFYLGNVPRGRPRQKAAVMREASRRGFECQNDDEADALAGLDLICHRLKFPDATGGALFARSPNP